MAAELICLEEQGSVWHNGLTGEFSQKGKKKAKVKVKDKGKAGSEGKGRPRGGKGKKGKMYELTEGFKESPEEANQEHWGESWWEEGWRVLGVFERRVP